MVLNQLSAMRKRIKYICDSIDAMRIAGSVNEPESNPRYDKRHAGTGRPELPPDWIDEPAEVTRDQAEALRKPPGIVTAGGATGKSFSAVMRPGAVSEAAVANLIPPAVGRLDDVVAAMAAGDKAEAVRMLWERGKIVAAKRAEYQRLTDQADDEMRAVLDFAERYSGNEGFREMVRQVCEKAGE